jgi:hypothetical protein
LEFVVDGEGYPTVDWGWFLPFLSADLSVIVNASLAVQFFRCGFDVAEGCFELVCTPNCCDGVVKAVYIYFDG